MSREEYIVNGWLFFVGRFLFKVLFGTLWRRKIVGAENIPATGGVIIAPNHMSAADPPLVGSAMRRPLHFMAKKELFDVPVLGVLIRRTNAFPVARGKQDIGAFKTILSLLKSGHPALVFPEGTRSKDGNIGRARAGVGMIACMSQMPVVPVRIVNSNKLGSFKQIKVIFGKPLFPPKEYTKESYLQFSEQVVEEIKKLA
jgi:1-acyl-sn-glycerol-3-phosphate acyltransferase